MNLYLGQKVKHRNIYNGSEIMTVVGLRFTEVELEGDWSGGTHSVTQKDWMPIKGTIYQNNWGAWIDEENDISFIKNAGPRD